MMKFATLLRKPPEWMQHDGPHRDIVLTEPYPPRPEPRRIVLPRLGAQGGPGGADAAASASGGGPSRNEGLLQRGSGNLDAIRKQVLVEKHLISREQAAKAGGSAAVINRDQSLSIMINEEDHLRMQKQSALILHLRAAFATLDRVDSELENLVPYAYDQRYGYLTACPTNLWHGNARECDAPPSRTRAERTGESGDFRG